MNDRKPTLREAALEQVMTGFRATGAEHRNCAQSVLIFALLRLGLDLQPVGLARYCGGGLARQGLTCGLLLGSALALGARDTYGSSPADPNAGLLQLQQLTQRFIARFGSSCCSELTGCDLSTAEGLAAFRLERRAATCTEMLEWVTQELDGLLVTTD